MAHRATNEIQALCIRAIINANLEKNVEKGHWGQYSRTHLFGLFLVEVRELFLALVMLFWYECWYKEALGTKYAVRFAHKAAHARKNVMHEAGDCVCFLAFIFDKI